MTKPKLKNEDDHAWKMTINRRKPPNMDSGISQQPLNES